MRTTLVLVFLAIPGVLGACSIINKSCTDIGCRDGLSIEFTSPLATQGELITITIGGDVQLTCTQRAASENGACADAGITFPRAAPGTISGLHVHDVQPNQVEVTLSIGAGVLAQGSGAPIYQVDRPNGEGCEPICRSGTLVVQSPR